MRIGIVNDTQIAIEALRRVLMLRPRHQVVWVARSGAEAVAHCARETPDLILMDLIMPGIDGTETTRRIMAATPCAILIVTGSVNTNTTLVFKAMGYGALDAIDTPQLGINDHLTATPFLAKVDSIEELLRDHKTGQPIGPMPAVHRPALLPDTLVAIGASAGGPTAIRAVLHSLPKNFPASVVVVQHVDEQFAPGMAEWLNQDSPLPVQLARQGAHPATGTVLLAGTNDHLLFNGSGRLVYNPEPRDYAYRPSVDIFFQSVSEHWPGTVIGVLLTGMGRDGAVGLKALRDKGHHTIAQDRRSSAVYGMPKAAAELGAAVNILPLDRIGPKLINLLSART